MAKSIDDRFDSFNDPRFKRPRKKDTKVTIDSRFKKGLEEFKNEKSFTNSKKDSASYKELKKYYDLKEEDEDKNESDEESESSENEKINLKPKSDLKSKLESKSESDSDSDSDSVVDYDPARGIGLISSSEESSSEEEDDDLDTSDIDSGEEVVVEENQVELGDESKRFAAVNLDWDHIKAVDLLIAFSSFAPIGGKILSVAIYPSEFGKEHMEIENLQGPPPELFSIKSNSIKTQNDSNNKSNTNKDKNSNIDEENQENDYDNKKLRKYQLQRLRYYYAVVTCDSIKTASTIYNLCDGTEYEATANFFDLRYIPDDVTFDDEPVDLADKIPNNYKPLEFITDALQHSKVKLTWDETPAERLKVSQHAFSQREIEDMDFKAYLASSDSEESEDDAELKKKRKDKLRGLLNGLQDFTSNSKKDDVDMEVTFTPALSTKNPESDDTSKELTTIEKYKAKEKEKRLRYKQSKMEKDARKIENNDDDKGFDDDFFKETITTNTAKVDKKSKQKEDKKEKEKDEKEEKKKRAELELLIEDDDYKNGGQKRKDFDMKEIMKAEKEAKRKGKRKNKSKEVIEDDFKLDVSDPRFSAVFTENEYAIDPTQSQYKNTNAMRSLMDERQRRRKQRNNTTIEIDNVKNKKRKRSKDTDNDNDIKSLVASVRAKSKMN